MAGIGFLALVRWGFKPETGFMGRSGPGTRRSAIVFLVLFVHSLPEGFALGTAFASGRAGLSLFVILAITIQNIPEGPVLGSRWRRQASAEAANSGQPLRPVHPSRSEL